MAVTRLPVVLKCARTIFAAICLVITIIARANGQQFPQAHNIDAPAPPPNIAQIPVELGSVDSATGALHLEIPIASFPQRGGLSYNAKLVYDSSLWVAYGTAQTLSQQPLVIQNTLTARLNSDFGLHGIALLGGWRLVTSNAVESDAVSYGGQATQCDPNFFPDVTSYTVFSGFNWRGSRRNCAFI